VLLTAKAPRPGLSPDAATGARRGLGAVAIDKPTPALRRVAARLAPAILAALAAIALAACGSSKPAYCSARSDLENAIKGLSPSGGVSGLKSQVQKIQASATTLVSKAKSDFPNETSAISSSVASLENAVKSLSSSPSAGQIATVASAASGVATSVKAFLDSTKSKCG
jgi:hypothetical protein